MPDKNVIKFGIIFVFASLCCFAQSITFQAASPVASIAAASTAPVTIGQVTSSPSAQAVVISDLEPGAWLANGSVCSPKQGSLLVTTPANVAVCIDPALPAGSHYIFFSAETTKVT